MKKKIDENNLYKEGIIANSETKNMALLDKSDKLFMITYLLIFIFGIILTILSI